jgi:hypothetical protein
VLKQVRIITKNKSQRTDKLIVKSGSTDLQRQCSFDLDDEQGVDGVEGDVPGLHVDRVFQS